MSSATNSEWAERPCSAEWTVNRQPCNWFKAGPRCHMTWGDLVDPLQYVVIFVAELNLMLAGALIIDAVIRKRAYSGAEFGAPYQRLVYVVLMGFVAIGIASVDLNGGNKILSVGWRLGLQVAIRVLVELALFEVADSYTHALRTVMPIPATAERVPETQRVLARAALAALFSGGIATWEVTSVPPRHRNGCLLSVANTVRNVGTATIDFSFFLYTFCYARAAKKIISDRLECQPSSKSLHADKRAIDVLTTHIFALCICMGAVFSFAVFAAYRNAAAGKFLCEQPACRKRDYPSRILWAFWYHCGVWVIVVAMVPNRLATRIGNAVTACASVQPAPAARPRLCCHVQRPHAFPPDDLAAHEEGRGAAIEHKVELPDSTRGTQDPSYFPPHQTPEHLSTVSSQQLRNNCLVS
mmetsp:Transcript_19305/g.60731  ORF Transcript_19305/g.60731 Transcript_19305/m.60731 type:complete len:412 (-) Transcript_19305:512-1747(-)